jgi:hypothetical protein
VSYLDSYQSLGEVDNMNWIAYCTTCAKELENCPNGMFASGAARVHRKNNPEHQIIVGYYEGEQKPATSLLCTNLMTSEGKGR